MISNSLEKLIATLQQQIEETISSIELLSDEQFVLPVKLFNGSSLGQHYRHIIEFVLCMLDGNETGVVNYDHRMRNINIETNRLFALGTLQNILHRLSEIKNNKSFLLEGTYGVDQLTSYSISSSLERELCYNIEHTVHHLAMIRIGMLEVCNEVTPSKNFGVASSTSRYKNSNS